MDKLKELTQCLAFLAYEVVIGAVRMVYPNFVGTLVWGVNEVQLHFFVGILQ
jgi:hypothetical protein